MVCSATIIAMTTMINATKPCTRPLNKTLSPKEKLMASRITIFEPKTMAQVDRIRSTLALVWDFALK